MEVNMNLKTENQYLQEIASLRSMLEAYKSTKLIPVAITREGFKLEWAPPDYGVGIPPDTLLYSIVKI